MDIYKVIDEAITFYDIDLKYKEMCHKCIEQIKLEKFNFDEHQINKQKKVL